MKRFIFYISTLAFALVPATARANPINVTVSLNVGDTILRVNGKTSPGAFVTIQDGGSVIGTTTANGSGNFDKSFPAQNPGLHTLKIHAEDPASNVTTDTVTQSVSLQPQAKTTVTFFLPTTLVIANDQVPRGGDLTVSGRTIPNGNVTVRLDDNQNFTSAADSSGNWSLNINTTDFVIGIHRVFAVANDSLGAHSSPTTERQFTVLPEGAQAPNVPKQKTSDGTPGEGDDEDDDEEEPGGFFSPLRPVNDDGGVNIVFVAFAVSTITFATAALVYLRPGFWSHLLRLFRR